MLFVQGYLLFKLILCIRIICFHYPKVLSVKIIIYYLECIFFYTIIFAVKLGKVETILCVFLLQIRRPPSFLSLIQMGLTLFEACQKTHRIFSFQTQSLIFRFF